jgi:hypothetical protein
VHRQAQRIIAERHWEDRREQKPFAPIETKLGDSP